MDIEHRIRTRIARMILMILAAFVTGILVGMAQEWVLDCVSAARQTKAQTVTETEEEPVRKREEPRKKVALTFDDGPNPLYTMSLLKGLKKRGVQATFFALGSEVEKYPQIVRAAAADGHLIGVHAYSHVNLCELSDEDAFEQVERTNQAIYDATGKYASFIRPPFGCWKKHLDERTQLIEVLWDVDPRDWNTTSSSLVVQRVLSSVKEDSIILLHDASKSSVHAAFTIIDSLKKQGYTFVTVDELIMN
ncbi:MAG: polysaccharide deacetylase family protein [bacterium]|nr:polysaccharide deacetylase family protein [bacterium]